MCVAGAQARSGPPPREPGINYLNPGEEAQMVSVVSTCWKFRGLSQRV